VEVFFYHQEHQGEAASNMPSGSEVKEVPTHEVPAPVPRKRKEHADIRLRRDESAQSELDGLAPYWENWLRYQQQNGNAGKFVRRQDHVQRFLIVWIPCAVSLFAMVYCASNISRLLQNALYWVCAVVGVIVAWSVAATWLWLYEEIGAVTNLRDSIPKQSKQKNEDQETKQVEANTGKSPSWWRRIWMKLRTCLPSRLPNWVNKYRFKVAVFVVIGVCWFLALWGSHRLLASGVINVSSQRTNELTLQFGTNILRLDLISHLPRPNTNASLGGGAVGALPP